MPESIDEQELRVLVTNRTEPSRDVVLLELARADGGALPAWTPGAHVDLVLRDDVVRQYSLCGEPADRARWRVAVLREADGRGGSLLAHALRPGDVVRARGPRNHFPLVEADRYVFVAGGIGVTPIVPMLREVIARGADWELVYGGRTRHSMAFRAELEALAPDRVTVYPQDEVGVIDLPRHLGEPTPGTVVYACGPGGLLEAVEASCAGWPAGALHTERFTPKDVGAPVRSDAFEVELRRSGLVVSVPPERTILDVVTDAGVDVLSSCTEGTCGSCETVVLDGAVDHRDSLLTPEEQTANETMMICVSRASCARLVLDL
ncbi:Ferredoxin-NADP reductase [Jatrophihabitans endophyticus]|uniref:Ferredoxin-NADP reductase n=1 Tax=Jatrophihabitans endophyticus TaxID=1206085 RepID=A0A1M5PQF9_9ACTN|nr:PDR/VanB family oxidoreductase [Jatrophihabitans endophyticus]SHH03998.1 Ferredoxin-NADP reductase [Jatrophihabitans endophyticus]